MTVNTLLAEVAALGFESEIEADTAFLSAAGRALRMIAVDRPIRRSYRVFLSPVRPASCVGKILHHAKDALTYPLCGVAFSFRFSGEGTYTVTDEDGTRSVHVNGKSVPCRGFFRGEGKITFSGDFLYTVTGLCTFSEVKSADAAAIPLSGEPTMLDMEEEVSDFLAFDGLPLDEGGKPILQAHAEGSTVSFPCDFSGEAEIVYRKCPAMVVADGNAVLDVAEDAAHLLPLLTASYLWLDDDESKARYYFSLYRDGMDGLRRSLSRTVGNAYRDIYGWT